MAKKQLGFFLDQQSCNGCFTCQIACKDKNDLDVGQRWRRVEEFCEGGYIKDGDTVRANVSAYWLPISCNHCADPKCVHHCPTGAMYKREEDGIVLVNIDKCIGCGYCAWSCPYGAPQLSGNVIGKCNFCIDLLEQGEDPACVSACPMRALHYGDLEELRQKYGEVAEVKGMPSAKLTKPSLVIKPHKDAIV